MSILYMVNEYLSRFDSIIGALGLIVAIIGIIVGVIGRKEIKEANRLKIQFGDLKSQIDKIKVNDSQFAQTINNNGIERKEVKKVTKKIVDKKIRNKPDEIISEEEPKGQKDDDHWMKPF